jgi:hypothetical protein
MNSATVLSNGKNLETAVLYGNPSTANHVVIPPNSVADRLSASNVTSHMHRKTAKNLMAPPTTQNVQTAVAFIQPKFHVNPDTSNNSTITNGQPVNNVKYVTQDPHCPHFEINRPNSQR